MFTLEEKTIAVELLIKYDMSYATTIRELGYPSRGSLRTWYKDYIDGTGAFDLRKRKHCEELKMIACKYYYEHGRCNAKTRRALGYPNTWEKLNEWLCEVDVESLNLNIPDKAQVRRRKPNVKMTTEQQDLVTLAFENTDVVADKICKATGISRSKLYNLKHQLDEERLLLMNRSEEAPKSMEEASKVIAALEKRLNKMQLENDVLKGKVEILGKDASVGMVRLTNKEKALLVKSLRPAHCLNELLEATDLKKSTYFYQLKNLNKPDKYAEVRLLIIKAFEENYQSYGYGRIHIILKKKSITISEKVVRNIMREEGLRPTVKRRTKYSSYKGEIDSPVKNYLKRDFSAPAPNMVWLTDISEFAIPAGKVYFSPIRDCYDGSIIAASLSTSPNAELVNSSLKNAITTLKPGQAPIIHSDRGCHYRWPEWKRICKDAKLIRSMSKKGCSPDNSAMEGFFGTFKNEVFYGRDWNGWSIEEFIAYIKEAIVWYNETRIKSALGYKTIKDYRLDSGVLLTA